MPCLEPRTAWIDNSTPRRVLFEYPFKDNFRSIEIPCGKCLECRKKQAREWSIRIVHEAEEHEENSFITLTYDDENLPEDGLQKKDLQLFLKRLRAELGGKKIRYFAVGEYGEQYSRPHYHAIIFGLDISNESEYNVIKLEKTWGKGFVSSGTVTPASCAYVAGYVQKKLNKTEGDYVDKSTGVIRQREFSLMSRGRGENRGIGFKWIQKNHVDTYNDDSVVIDKRKNKSPRYYDKVVFSFAPEKITGAKNERIAKGALTVEDYGKDRQDSRRKISKAKDALRKKRGYENV